MVLEEQIEIDMPIQELWNMVTTPRLWELIYPNTVAVGGQTARPMSPGDLILEKFLFGGFLFGAFNFVLHEDLYRPPSMKSPGSADVVFSMELVQTLTCLDQCCCLLSNNMGGTFEYNLEQKGGSTQWTRRLYLYHVGGCVSELYYRLYVCC